MRREKGIPSSSNRAEEVRKRKSERSNQRASVASSRVVNPVMPARPVVFRGSSFGTPIHRQSGKRARRQFYVAMDHLGTELRLPAIRLVNPGWRILSAILFILSAVGAFSLWGSPFFRVYGVEVSGLQRLNADEISGMLNLENLSIVEVNISEAEAAVAEAFPELMDIQLKVIMPNIVSISAVERQPVLAVQIGDEVTWVDEEGAAFPARGDAGPLLTIYAEDPLPTAPAPLEQATAQPAQQQQGQEAGFSALASSLKKNIETAQPDREKVDPVLLAAVEALSQKLTPETQIIYNAQNGLGWIDAQGWQVYIGANLNRFEEKISLYQTITDHLNSEGLQPVIISVEHLNAPFYRLEQ